MTDLLMFYGTECKHCHEMFPLIEKLDKEEKLKIKKIEIWHNSKNKKIYDKYNKGMKCTGVPFFFNKKTKKNICGSVPYKELKEWAKP
jgi:thiol-disulfide isomerase/thioredoxin